MPQSLSRVLIHLIFSTRGRNTWITREAQPELHSYLAGVLRNLSCPVLQVGGAEDHVHLLFGLSRTRTIAEVVEATKTGSSKWMKSHEEPEFGWQHGYGAFSVSEAHANAVVSYIQNQHEHHKKWSYQEEFRKLMQEIGVEIDERYVWD